MNTFLVAGLLGLIPQLARAEFLFVHFKMEKDALCEQVYFGISKDGLSWETVNQGNPVLVSTVGEQGVRDPHIIRSSDGKRFFLVATDLSIFRNRDWTRAVQKGSRALVVWESDDLIRWSVPRRVEVAPKDAGCTWAPEISWDAAKGAYLVYWASTTKRDAFGKQRIWAAYTKDFKTFSAPFVYIEQASHVIDTTIVRDGNIWFRFTKDERTKAITMEKSTSLVGSWQPVDGFSLKGMTGYEGPTCYQLQNGSWCLLLDHYSKGQGYKAFFANQLTDGQFTPDAGQLKMPYKYRHGTVLKITKDEYQRLKAMGDSRKPPQAVLPGVHADPNVVRFGDKFLTAGTSPLGPFTRARENPVLKGEGIIRGAGHHSVIEFAPDQWAMVYHRFKIPRGNGYNRETCISPMGFDAGGGILPVDVFRGLEITTNPK